MFIYIFIWDRKAIKKAIFETKYKILTMKT